MPTGTESPEDRKAYRTARRAFIAACEAAHVDTVARLHPAKGPDAKPLFMDCAALGPRHASRAVLVVSHDKAGSDMLVALLPLVSLPTKARLVFVHALDPALFAGVPGDPAWPHDMLGAVATEDLSKVRDLGVLTLARPGQDLEPVLQARLPDARITLLSPAANTSQAQAAIASFLAP